MCLRMNEIKGVVNASPPCIHVRQEVANTSFPSEKKPRTTKVLRKRATYVRRRPVRGVDGRDLGGGRELSQYVRPPHWRLNVSAELRTIVAQGL
jgi:hypothetical protein